MKKLILTLSLALALTMTASANGNEVSRAKTLVAYFSFPIDSFIAFGNAGAPLLSLICCVSCQEKKAGKIIRQFTNSYILG